MSKEEFDKLSKKEQDEIIYNLSRRNLGKPSATYAMTCYLLGLPDIT